MKKLVFILILGLYLFETKVVAQCSVVITDPAPVCLPATVDLTAAAVTDGSTPDLIFTYWTDDLASIPYETPEAATAGTYYIMGDDGAGCTDVKPVVVAVTTPPTATISYEGTPFCTWLTTDQPVTLSGTEAYSGGTFNSSEGLSIDPYTGTISPGISTPGTYIVYYSIPASGGCSSVEVTTSVTVYDCPTPTASNSGSGCKGSLLSLAGGPDGMNSYSWSGPAGFTSEEQNPIVSLSATTEMAGVYSLIITDNLGIEHTTSMTAIVRDISTVSATNNGPLCEDEYNEHRIVLTGSPDNMDSYEWSGPNGFTYYGQTARVYYDILDETSVAGTYTLTVNDGCSNIRSVTTDLVTYPIPSTTVSFPKYFCPGDSLLELKGGPDGMSSYLWVGPGGFSSTEQNPPPIANAVKGNYSLTVTNSLGCSKKVTKSFLGSVPASTCGNYIDNRTYPVCEGSTLHLIGRNTTSGLTALWTGPNGFSSTEWSTTVSTNATVDMAGTYTLTTLWDGCSATCETIIEVVVASPPVIGGIIQPTCELATGSIELTSLPAGYPWTITRLPDNVTISARETGATTSATISDLDPGTYAFSIQYYINSRHNICNSVLSDNVVISAYPGTPARPIIGTITQPNCAVGTGSVILDGLPATGNWTITRMPDGIVTKGKGTSTLVKGLLPGSYTFIASNGLKCNSAPSEDVVINVQPITPAIPVVEIITQPTCGVSSGSVQLGGLPAEEQWIITMTPGGSTTAGTGTSTTITELTSGSYKFIVTNASGCSSTSTSRVNISVSPTIPTAPIVGTITQPTKKLPTGSVVLKGLPATGKWKLTMSPGGIITTGTGKSKTIKNLAAGSYTWTVTNASGCISESSAYVIINPAPASVVSNSLAGEESLLITSPDNETQDNKITVYPNPVSGQLNISYSNEDFTTVRILNSSGVLMGNEKVIAPLQQLDFSRFQPGLYILEFINASGKIIRVKVLKN